MSDTALEALLKRHIRDVADFPKPGILFRDITPLLAHPEVVAQAVAALRDAAPAGTTHVAAVEARGFLFAAPLAAELQAAMVPVRKPGKLPRRTVRVDYDLEYGSGALEMHVDAVEAGAIVYLIDDLLATGGTLAAAATLIRQCGGRVGAFGCVVELSELNGRAALPADVPLVALARY